MAPRDLGRSLSAAVAASMVLLVGAAAWLRVSLLRDTAYWQSHFPTIDPRAVLLFAVPLGILAVLAPLVWPRTWESVHLTRSARSVTGGTVVYWVLAVLLDAPVLGAYVLLPILLAPAIATLGFLVKTTLPIRSPVMALAGTAAAVVLAVLLLAHLPRSPLRDLVVVGLGGGYLAATPWTLRRLRARTTAPREGPDPSGTRWRGTPGDPHPLDLPAAMQSPGSGTFGLALAVAALLFIAFVVAPGVPLTTFVRWTALALLLPVLLRGVVRRPGLARADALVGPPAFRVHRAQVAHLPDARLAALDDPLEHWLRTGRGHRALARALAALLAPVVPDADEARVAHALARMPRGRRHRARREAQLGHFLGLPAEDAAPTPAIGLRRLFRVDGRRTGDGPTPSTMTEGGP